MTTVFINYRRGETAGEARSLFNELAQTLGKSSVFMDVDAIALGRDFREVIREHIESCDLMLALIGRDWLTSKNTSGGRRLDDANDFVRLEIEAALKRTIPVIPVLLQGAQMPAADQMPESIRDFAYRNGFELSHSRWESDVREMIKRLGLGRQSDSAEREEKAQSTPAINPTDSRRHDPADNATGLPKERPNKNRRLAIAAVTALTIAVAGGGLLYQLIESKEAMKIANAQKEKAAADAAAKAEEQRTRQAEAEREAQAERKRNEEAAERRRIGLAEAERERVQDAEAERKRLEQAQAERKRLEQVQAERKRAQDTEAERKRLEQVQAERKRVEDAEAERKRQAQSQANQNPTQVATQAKYSGGIVESLGEFAKLSRLRPSELTIANTTRICIGWSQQFERWDQGAFQTACMGAADYAIANAWQLDRKPTTQEWMKFCQAKLGALRGPASEASVAKCLNYR